MENKEYRWAYNYSVFKNHDWIRSYCCILLITVLLISFALFLSRPHDFPGVLIENLWLIGMIVGIYVISVPISFVYYRKGYVYQYILKDNCLRVIRNYVPLSHEMIVNERIGSCIYFKDVRHIKLHKDEAYISIRGSLILKTIYADKNEIDQIYQLMKQKCVNLKDKK